VRESLADLLRAGLGALCEYFSANRACPIPAGHEWFASRVHRVREPLESWTFVTLALPGMVAHMRHGLASASVHARAAGAATSADTPGGEAVPGALITNARPARRPPWR